MNAPNYSVGDYDYWVAAPHDDAIVRGIFARIATGGRMQLSFRREPDAFASFGSLAQGYIVARNRRNGEYVGVCERVVREVFVNGEPRALPYLAGLRVVPGFRHRLLVLRGGFEAVRRLLTAPGDLPWSLTSIMSDNASARRLLGANLKGMPRYEPVGEFSTFALLPSGTTELERATEVDLPAIAELLMRQGVRSQFAACWRPQTLAEFARQGWLKPADYFVVRDNGVIRACAALWDQSAQRQLVVAGYSPWLRRSRPVINLASRLTASPRLPAPGEPLRAAYLSLVAVEDDAAEDLAALLAAARAEARRRGLHVVFAGAPSAHLHAAQLRKVARRREYRSQL
ncbi:MAG TPA: hypothetical protein VFO82_09550, partial [Steroidobacteraceae bacterium]|nr:hypothetical protein [Steroidobacteraceae bacterium]